MSHPIDVGSVLGGRYKVTATVLTSHDQDLVLDGVDQVLNRAVSILVAGPDNADQVAKSAREVATGERPGQMQILDLGVSDLTTYLITNHTSAADLLDLVVSSNPPYVEPFFTDTLGSEIFGQARSKEPETYDGLYDDEEVDAGYINYGQQPAGGRRANSLRRSSRPADPRVRRRPVTARRSGGRRRRRDAPPRVAPPRKSPESRTPGSRTAARRRPSRSRRRALPSRPRCSRACRSAPAQPAPAASASKPKVSLWSDEDYNDDGRRRTGAAPPGTAQPGSRERPRPEPVPAAEGPHSAQLSRCRPESMKPRLTRTTTRGRRARP